LLSFAKVGARVLEGPRCRTRRVVVVQRVMKARDWRAMVVGVKSVAIVLIVILGETTVL
jgi:hypothetical protein